MLRSEARAKKKQDNRNLGYHHHALDMTEDGALAMVNEFRRDKHQVSRRWQAMKCGPCNSWHCVVLDGNWSKRFLVREASK